MRLWINLFLCACLGWATAADPVLLLDQAESQLNLAADTGDPAAIVRAAETLSRAGGAGAHPFLAGKLRVRLLMLQSKPAEAETLALDLNKQMPDDLDLRGWLAQIYLAQGQTKQAMVAAQRILDMEPESAAALSTAALLRMRLGHPRAALTLYAKLLSKPEFIEPAARSRILAHVSEAYLAADDRGRAAEAAREALRLNPGLRSAARLLAENQTKGN